MEGRGDANVRFRPEADIRMMSSRGPRVSVRLTLAILATAIAAGCTGGPPLTPLAGPQDATADVVVGELLEVSDTTIELDRSGATVIIGFVGEPAALAGLDGLKAGDEVRAVFGTSGPSGINNLLSIRRCVKDDEQCAADRRKLDAAEAEESKAFALLQAQAAHCRHEMEMTLVNDPRYASPAAPSESQDRLHQVNSLTGKAKECARTLMNDHRTAVFDACELHHCGDQVGGGCSHIAGYSLSDAVVERAWVICKDK